MAYLFDNRYRCERIFPRGRSGEAILAHDQDEQNRKVIIKRPVPRDAPPIRARQEANILTERQILQQLAGHPSVPRLLRSGQFAVSGSLHPYLVLEYARGINLAEENQRLQEKGEEFPRIELLKIVDQLLDLLQYTHQQGFVYNDVDGRHLFWSRAEQHLTVIDWGNAVPLDTPLGVKYATPQGDLVQTAAWLFYMLTQSRAPAVQVDQFALDFSGAPTKPDGALREIIRRALQTNAKTSYPSATAMRADLTAHLNTLTQRYDAEIRILKEKVVKHCSPEQLQSARAQLENFSQSDPSHPIARELRKSLAERAVELDHEKILKEALQKLQEGDWCRSAELIATLTERAPKQNLLHLSVDFLLRRLDPQKTPPEIILETASHIAAGDTEGAVNTLIRSENSAEPGISYWLLANKLQATLPNMPNSLRTVIFALNHELAGEPLSALQQLVEQLDSRLGQAKSTISQLADAYHHFASGCTELLPKIPENPQQRDLRRARAAAEVLAKSLSQLETQATTEQANILELLAQCRIHDPDAPFWRTIEEQLLKLSQLYEQAQNFIPREGIHEIAPGLHQQTIALAAISLFEEDERLRALRAAVADAQKHWSEVTTALNRGDNRSLSQTLPLMRMTIRPYLPQLARWLESWQELLAEEEYLQRQAINSEWGQQIGEGWRAYDRGDLNAAQDFASNAQSLAKDQDEKNASRDLTTICQLSLAVLRETNANETTHLRQLLHNLLQQFLPEERTLLDEFDNQMPQLTTYLRAMRIAIVIPLSNRRPAAIRLLHLSYLLSALLALHEKDETHAEELQQAAKQCLPNAEAHPISRELAKLLASRESLLEAATRLNQINGPHGIPLLAECQEFITAHAEAEKLAPARASLENLRAALEHWARAEFVAAEENLTTADKNAASFEQKQVFSLGPYRAWLQNLARSSKQLNAKLIALRANFQSAMPELDPREELRLLAEQSQRLVGEAHSYTTSAWRESAEAFYQARARKRRRSSALVEMEKALRNPRIEYHPALPLFQRWYEEMDRSPEFKEEDDAQEHTRTEEDLPYTFSRPPIAQENTPVADSETPDDLLGPKGESIASRQLRRWALFILIGLSLTLVMTLWSARQRAAGPSPEGIAGLASIAEAATVNDDNPLNVPYEEMDLLGWLTDEENLNVAGLQKLDDDEAWLLTATERQTAVEIPISPAQWANWKQDKRTIHAISAEFAVHYQEKEVGFGLRLREEGAAGQPPSLSLLLQPDKDGAVKIIAMSGDRLLASEALFLDSPIFRLSVRHDSETQTLSAHLNDTAFSEAISLSGEVIPSLFVNAGGSVRVLSWRLLSD